MIWSLAREQFRSERRYLAWTAAVLTVAVSLGAYSVMFTISMRESSAQAAAALGHDRERIASLSVVGDAQAASPEFAQVATDWGWPTTEPNETWASFSALTASVDQAVADGSNAVAEIVSYPYLAQPSADFYAPGLVALRGAVDWDQLIAAGAPPQAGEVVVSARYADRAHVSIGDTVALETGWAVDDEPVSVPVGITLTVSGISHSGASTPAGTVEVPSGFVAWSDSEMIWEAYDATMARLAQEDDLENADMYTSLGGSGATVAWDGNAPSLERYGGYEPYQPYTESSQAMLIAGVVGVGVVVMGLIAMAFAMGRAQAQSRTRWVATARTLGARRSAIVMATVVESAVLGLVCGILGYVLGWGATAAHLAWLRAPGREAAVVASPGFLPLVVAACLVLGLVLALIIGGVPAFWSARVPPVAALKPVTDISESEVSRRVSARPLAIAWGIAVAVLLIMRVTGSPGASVVVELVAGIVVVVGGFMLAMELLRWSIPRTGRRMARSRSKALMIAGDALVARPRQATIPAYITALALGALILITMDVAVRNSTAGIEYESPSGGGASLWYDGSMGWFVPTTIGVFVLVTLVCVAIAASAASLTSREAATREALGVTRAQGRLAAALAYATAQLHGTALGIVMGLFTAAWLVQAISGDVLPGYFWQAVAGAMVLVGGLAIAALIATVAGAAVVYATAPQAVPAARLEVAA